MLNSGLPSVMSTGKGGMSGDRILRRLVFQVKDAVFFTGDIVAEVFTLANNILAVERIALANGERTECVAVLKACVKM